MTERPRRSRMAQPTMEQPRIRTQGTPHPPGAYPPDKFSTPIKRQIGRKKTSPSQPPRYFFFFFFFYSHLTPYSPTGMAGGPIRTPNRGANYIHTKQNLQKPESLTHTHSYTYIHGMPLYPNTLSYANQDPIQGDKEIFHPVRYQPLPTFPFHGISPPGLIVQLLP